MYAQAVRPTGPLAFHFKFKREETTHSNEKIKKESYIGKYELFYGSDNLHCVQKSHVSIDLDEILW